MTDNPTLYHCHCGCILTKDKLVSVRKTVDGKSYMRWRCSEHSETTNGEVDFRSTLCEECGKRVEFTKSGGTAPQTCADCFDKVRLRKMRAYGRKRNKNKKKKKPYPKFNNTWDCKNFHLCGMCVLPEFRCKMFKRIESTFINAA